MKLKRLLKKIGLTCKPCSKGYHLSSERPLFSPRLTVTSLDVKENGQIFIGTFSLERCSAEQSVIVDVIYLSVYLVWQSPQVCWVLVSTGTCWERNVLYHLLVLTLANTQHTPSASRWWELMHRHAYARTHTHTLNELQERSCEGNLSVCN